MTDGGVPPSEGYLLVDSTLCSGCRNCMLACSLVHEGKTSLSLSRIQVLQDVLGSFPDDIQVKQCRQCPESECVVSCPHHGGPLSSGVAPPAGPAPAIRFPNVV